MSGYNCILVIDDDKITQFITKNTIQKVFPDTQAYTFLNVRDALAFILNYSGENESNCPELIFVDINLPEMNGFEFAETIQSIYFNNRNKIKVVFLSNSINPEDRKEIDSKGLSFIEKPLTKEKLENLLLATSN